MPMPIAGPSAPSLPLFVRLLDQLPVGVVLLDRDGRVVHYNQAEERLARRSRTQVIGRRFFQEVAPCMNVREMGGRFFDAIGRTELAIASEFAFPFPFLERPRDVRVELRSFDFDGQPYGCLFVEDVSAQRSIERLKDSLAQMLVHDLKNPLAAILRNLAWIESRAIVPEGPGAEALLDTRLAAQRLHGMLLTMLDISRIETQTLRLARRPVDLRQVVATAIADSSAQARSVNLELVAELPDAPVLCAIDVDLVRRVLGNLIDNALRYARRRVRVAAAPGAAGQVRLTVTDDGAGIPAALQEVIFDKHVQADGERAERRDNRGLGLTFVRLVARAHGGDASCEDGAEGGTCFVVTLGPGGEGET